MIDVFCLKYGQLYNCDHVNLLFNRLQKKIKNNFNFVCITDDSSGLDAKINTVLFKNDPSEKTFNKIRIYDPSILTNNRTLYFDLDVIIQNDVLFLLDDIMLGGVTTVRCTWSTANKNFKLPYSVNAYAQGNSSIVGFYGDDPEIHRIYHEYVNDQEKVVKKYYNGDDIFLLNNMYEINNFAIGTIYSYKYGLYSSVNQYQLNGEYLDHNYPFIDEERFTIRPNLNICLLNQIKDKQLIFDLYEKYHDSWL